MYSKDEKEIEKLRKDKLKADKKGNLKEVATLANYLGELLAKIGKFEEAKQEHEQELSLCEALDDSIGAAVACRKIGENYCDLQDYEKALQFQQRHLNLAKKCDNLIEEQRAWATIGRTYFIKSENSNNSETTTTALHKALDAFHKSLHVCEDLKVKGNVKEVDYFEMKARLYLNIGLVHDGLEDTKLCADNLKRAITLAERHHLDSDLYRCRMCLASMYQRSGNLSQAIRFLDAAQKIAVKLRDKQLECDTLTTKAMISCQIGDFSSSKHALKKAYKLCSTAETENLRKLFHSVTKLEEATISLEMTPTTPCDARLRLFESLGDCSAEAGSFKQAIEYYLQMLKCAEDLKKPLKDFIPIYVSLAQTYADDKQYKNAILYYNKEIEARGDDATQVSKTLLNIAEIEYSDGQDYDKISDTYLKAYKLAKKAQHHLLEFHVLKALTEVQRSFNKKGHLKQTSEQMKLVKEKYDIDSSDELSDDERDSQKLYPEDDDTQISISELSESDVTDDEVSADVATSATGRARRVKASTKRNEKGETPLHRACIEGNLKKVQKLIEQGHPVNPRDHCGWIPLHEAANHDFLEIVQYLLEHGAAVNDRGGQHCGGVTPLIDAASCGNMEVMELLISKGANVLAKDDGNNTALDCLRAWRQRCDTMTDELVASYTELENKLQRKLPSHISVREENQGLSAQSSSAMPLLTRPKKANERNLRRTLSSGSESEEMTEPEATLLTDDSQETYPNPRLQKEKAPKRATDFYRSAIKGVGLSATKMVSPSQPRNSQAPKEVQPFLAEEETPDDDWLIDDMRPANKKRRLDVNDVFSTSQTSQRAPKRKKNTSDQEPFRSLSDTEESDINAVTVLPSLDYQDEDIGSLPNDFCVISESENSNDSVETRPRSNRLSRKPRQMKLTNFGVRKSNSLVTDENVNGDLSAAGTSRLPLNANSNLSPLRPVSSELNPSANLPSSQVAPGLLTQSVAFPVGSLRVRVKDLKILVPVFEKDLNSTVTWLAQETASRYQRLTGLQCALSIQLGDGSVLSPDDPVTLLLSSKEEIKAIIEHMDLLPMSQQYEQSCQELSCKSYRNIKTILLQSNSNGGKLDFQNLALRPMQLKPIFKALQFQQSITELCLKGNRLGDQGLEDLLSVLRSLTGLTSLDLSCNGVTKAGLKALADCVSSIREEAGTGAPKKLQHLSLSNNWLGDTCCSLLNTVISSLPSLETLELSSCGFTSNLFQQNRLSLVETVKKSSIHTLDVSCNSFHALGVELVLCCLNPSHVTSLNLTGTVTANGVIHLFLHHIEMFLSQDNSVLADLTLSSCQIGLDDKDKLVRLVTVGKKLHRLDISCNPKLTTEVIGALLSESAKQSSPLEQLVTEGCTALSPLNSDFLDSLNDKLQSARPLTYLSMSRPDLEKVDVECLSDIWTQAWQAGVGAVKQDSGIIRLCVRTSGPD